jgi:hypothetical protein
MNWFYPSLNGSGEVDTYVKFNKLEKLWDYGSLCRTAFIDQTAFGPPMGVDETGLVQQHELSPDANGAVLHSWAHTGWFDIADGDLYLFLERMLPDFKFAPATSTVLVTVYVQDYTPQGEALTYTYGPYTVTQATEFFIVRARGRQAAVKIESTDLGSFWRVGKLRYYVSPVGKR